MQISTVSYLINHAVGAALEMQQQANDSPNQAKIRFYKDKEPQQTNDIQQGSIASLAYRVNISPAAMQKMAALRESIMLG